MRYWKNGSQVTIILILSFLVIFSTTDSIFAASTDLSAVNKPTYSITTPYTYPLTPDDARDWLELWKKINSTTKVLEFLTVPRDVAQHMTTEALIDTILTFPLATYIGESHEDKASDDTKRIDDFIGRNSGRGLCHFTTSGDKSILERRTEGKSEWASCPLEGWQRKNDSAYFL
ncbi:hypothetical protein [Paenibacillus donghaensis]|uniref:Uncharacterized protein n=1 Tax=Paenibacillus donghaensis TaxID=414771 RepID=A0A2Z2K9S0_9BACL|nr:hypothetical protein [Paenibacillus donghaensis]ASA23436.1 hypothetical protein B9T62_23085 [Paenibacillus donghaensis]